MKFFISEALFQNFVVLRQPGWCVCVLHPPNWLVCITQPNSQGGDTPHNTLLGYPPLYDNYTGPLLRKKTL